MIQDRKEEKKRKRKTNVLDKFEPLKVEMKKGEDIKNLIRRFNKSCERSGKLKEIKRKAEYEKPCEIRKREARKRLKNIAKYRMEKNGTSNKTKNKKATRNKYAAKN